MPPPARNRLYASGWWSRPALLASRGLRISHHRGAAEFAAPDHQRVVQQAALLQVLDQRRGGLVGDVAVLLELAIEVGVVVPTGVVQHDEAHAALHHAARQQAVGGELAGGLLVHAVHGERLRAIPSRNRAAPARPSACGSQFVGGDARGDLHVAGLGVVLFVQIFQRVETGALHLARDAGRVREIEHRVARTAEHHALIGGRQKAARPVGASAAGADAGAEHDESRQVLRLAAQPVEHPRAHGRAAHLYAAAEEQQLAGMVVEGVGVHGAHQAEIVGAGADVRDEIGELDAALPVRRETRGLASTAALGLVKARRRSLVSSGRQRLAVPLLELGLGVEEIDLAGPALHEHEDDVLGLGREVRLARRQRVHVPRRRRGRPVPAAAPARWCRCRRRTRGRSCGGSEFCGTVRRSMAYSLVMNSSRLSSTRLNSTQAAASACGTPSRRLGKSAATVFGSSCETASGVVEILAHALGLARRGLRARA